MTEVAPPARSLRRLHLAVVWIKTRVNCFYTFIRIYATSLGCADMQEGAIRSARAYYEYWGQVIL